LSISKSINELGSLYNNFLSTKLLPEVFAILDKIPAREIPEWDRKE